MPREYPSSFEAGNLNVPALAGWLAGLRSRSEKLAPELALQASRQILSEMASRLYQGLDAIAGIHVIGRPSSLVLPVASIAVDGLGASDAALILDSEFGIEVRSGFHCAALIHKAIGSPIDGTLRISCAASTQDEELELLFAALAELGGSAVA